MNWRRVILAVIFSGSVLAPWQAAWAIVAPPETPADFTGDWAAPGWSLSTVAVYPWTNASNSVRGSAVAIGANYLLTADHVGAVVGQTWSPDGLTTYTVTGVSHPPNGPNGPVDLCLIKLDKPLPSWEKLYTAALSPGQNTIMVGTGLGGTTYPDYYTWDDNSSRQKRWGSNTIDFVQEIRDDLGHSSSGFIMWYNTTDYTTPYEAGLANFDSGGGTFVKLGDSWRLAGINTYVGGAIGGGTGYDRSYAVSVPAYANWLIQNMTVPGDANIDGKVNFADYITLANNFGQSGTWYEGDFNGDGKINFSDYILLANNFGQAAPAPEPAALSLLLLGGAGAMLRRRLRR